ncbi:aconitate hydratase [Coemansia sp. RSA 1933]|nr:aconitate hydratase [Coemansia sp. RSA 1933]
MNICSTRKKRRWDDEEEAIRSHEPAETEASNPAAAIISEPTAPDAPEPINDSANDGQLSVENSDKSFTESVDINHSLNRQSLAKSMTQKAVMEATGVEISTRGRYYANPDDATPEDPALHLFVQAQSQEALANAVSMIERMKEEAPADTAPPVIDRLDQFSGSHVGVEGVRDGHSGYRSGSSGSRRLNEKLYIEVESERGFNVRAKLIGTGGENMKFIQNTTGARVQVRGRGSGHSEYASGPDASEPMHLLITAQNEDSLRRACENGASLVDTVRAQYYEFKETGGRRHDHSRHGYPRNEQYHNNGYGYRQNAHHQQYQSSNPNYNNQQVYSQYPQQQPQPTADEPAAEYDYASYYAQYYQYYGSYPNPNATQMPEDAVSTQEQQAYAEYYYQQQQQRQQQQQQQDPMLVPGIDLNGEPKESSDGYHSVPPPPNYSNKD